MNAKQQIIELIEAFGKEQLSINPEEIEVDIHQCSVVATLQGITLCAERRMAKEQTSRERLEKMYKALFEIAKPVLETGIETIIGCAVEQSIFTVDINSGNAVLVVFLRKHDKNMNIVCTA